MAEKNMYPPLALFDLDHTLLPLDSDYAWAQYLAQQGYLGDPEIALQKNEELMQAYDAGTLNMHDSMAFMLGLLTHHSPAELATIHESFMASIIRPAIQPAAIALVESHMQAGHLCALVTATNRFVISPIARAFGFAHVLATEPEYLNGRYTGKTDATPCFQGGKIIRVDQWLTSLGLQRANFTEQYFYSDSINDLPLLEVVHHPIATNPSSRLRKVAQERQWQILELFS